jgi:integrase
MKVVPVKKPYTPFKVDLPVSVTGTRRVRKFFASAEEGAAYIGRVKRLGFANADTRSAPGSVSVADLCVMWKAHKKATLKGRSMAQHRLVCKLLCEKHGRTDITQMTHQEISAWLNGVKGGPTHKRNCYRVAKRIFQWAQDWAELIPRNPFKKVPVPTGDRNPIQILQPERMREILATAAAMPEPDRGPLLAFVALGGFAGVRTCEILRMLWKDVGEKEIYIASPKRTKRGLRPRYVDVLPALAAVLDEVPRAGEKVIPWAETHFRIWHLNGLRNALGWEKWPANCLRHSYRTYHVAEFESIEKTRLQMGHGTSDMTAYQYGSVDRKSVASDWWDAEKVKKAIERSQARSISSSGGAGGSGGVGAAR